MESISPAGIAGGVAVALLAVALAGGGYYRPAPVVAVAIAVLAVALAARGLKPFGDTVAYHLLQAAAFALWGLAVILVENLTVIPVAFVFVGLGGVGHYGRRGVRQGLWTPVGE